MPLPDAEPLFGVVLAMGTVFESPTIAQMAAAIEAARGRGHAEERPPEAAIAATEPPPPVPQPAVADPTTAEPHLVPIRFGPPGRELLGLYQWPSDGQNQGRCCLLCNPFGQAAVRSHRVFRVLADRLARSGLHVLRFDYFGAGDSPGADDEGTLASWVEDILRANDELVRRSGQSRVVWLGLGIGATLAARASRLADRVPAHLVLWDPVTDGPAWLAELAAAHISERRKEFGPRWEAEPWIRTLVAEEAKTEGLGYPVTTTLKAEMGALTPASCRGIRAERVTLVGSGANDGVTSLREQLANSGVEVRTLTLESSITWLLNDMLSDSVIPSEDLRRLVEAASE